MPLGSLRTPSTPEQRLDELLGGRFNGFQLPEATSSTSHVVKMLVVFASFVRARRESVCYAGGGLELVSWRRLCIMTDLIYSWNGGLIRITDRGLSSDVLISVVGWFHVPTYLGSRQNHCS